MQSKREDFGLPSIHPSTPPYLYHFYQPNTGLTIQIHRQFRAPKHLKGTLAGTKNMQKNLMAALKASRFKSRTFLHDHAAQILVFYRTNPFKLYIVRFLKIEDPNLYE